MRITSKGQVTIPQAIREQAGLMPGAEVEFEIDGKTVRIALARKPGRATRGERIVARLRGAGGVARVRRVPGALHRPGGGRGGRGPFLEDGGRRPRAAPRFFCPGADTVRS